MSKLTERDLSTIKSPLGATVVEYERLLVFLYKFTPVMTIIFGFSVWLPYYLYTIGSNVTYLFFSILFFIASAVMFYIAAYGLWRTGTWLPSIFEPQYELIRVQTIGASGTRKETKLTPPKHVLKCPFSAEKNENLRALWEEALTESEADRQSIILRVVYTDRLGNQVFQYVGARLRAMYLDIAFEAPKLGAPFNEVSTFVDRWDATSSIDSTIRHPFLLRKRSCCSQAASSATRSTEKCDNCAGVSKLLSTPSWEKARSSVILAPSCRYSMNTRTMAGFESLVKAWLLPSFYSNLSALSEKLNRPLSATGTSNKLNVSASDDTATVAKPVLSFGPHDIVFHVRLGDILWGHHGAYRPLPLSFYKASVRSIQLQWLKEEQGRDVRVDATASEDDMKPPVDGRIIIVTESENHTLIAQLKSAFESIGWTVVTQSHSITGDLSTLLLAPQLVLSISSFAWWPAFLGQARHVVVPRWGMLTPHVWIPSSSHPQVKVQHDMSIPPSPMENALPPSYEVYVETMKGILSQFKTTVALSTAGKRDLGNELGRHQRLTELLQSLQTNTDSESSMNQYSLHDAFIELITNSINHIPPMQTDGTRSIEANIESMQKSPRHVLHIDYGSAPPKVTDLASAEQLSEAPGTHNPWAFPFDGTEMPIVSKKYVHEVYLDSLPRWQGKAKGAFESLFD